MALTLQWNPSESRESQLESLFAAVEQLQIRDAAREAQVKHHLEREPLNGGGVVGRGGVPPSLTDFVLD